MVKERDACYVAKIDGMEMRASGSTWSHQDLFIVSRRVWDVPEVMILPHEASWLDTCVSKLGFIERQSCYLSLRHEV